MIRHSWTVPYLLRQAIGLRQALEPFKNCRRRLASNLFLPPAADTGLKTTADAKSSGTAYYCKKLIPPLLTLT
ncbi:hypothetical protein Bhyg_13952, partial [Pseudolycoriella hygida]